MSQENLTNEKSLESANTFESFLMKFEWNRDPDGIKSQLNKYEEDQNFNLKYGEEFRRLNADLANKHKEYNFREKLTAGKEYSSKAIVMAGNRFRKMMKVIESKNKKGKKNDFFSNDNIKKVFLSFAKNRKKIEDSKNVEAEDRNKLVDDVLNDNYKILAIYYFAGILSAKDLDYFLRKLKSIQDILNKSTVPSWFEKFCLMAKTFFQSFVNRKVEKIGLDLAGFELGINENRTKNIVDSRHKSVFDRLGKATTEIGTQNWRQNKEKAQNKIKKTDLLK